MKKIFFRLVLMTCRYSILVFSILVIFTSFLSAKSGYGQETDPKDIFLSFQLEHQPLKKVFKVIETQTAFRFFYNSSGFNIAQPVTIKAKKESVSDILKNISGQTGLEFKQIKNYFSVRPKNLQIAIKPVLLQQKQFIPQKITVPHFPVNALKDTLVKGRVVNDVGGPLIGGKRTV